MDRTFICNTNLASLTVRIVSMQSYVSEHDPVFQSVDHNPASGTFSFPSLVPISSDFLNGSPPTAPESNRFGRTITKGGGRLQDVSRYNCNCITGDDIIQNYWLQFYGPIINVLAAYNKLRHIQKNIIMNPMLMVSDEALFALGPPPIIPEASPTSSLTVRHVR